MEILYISIVTIVSSLVGTITGFGSSTIMLPLLVLFFPFTESLLLAGILHVFNDIWKISLFRKHINWRIALEFGISGLIFSIAGAWLVFDIPESVAKLVLGIFFIAYVLFLVLHPVLKIKHAAWTAGAGGAVSGFFAGIFGLGGAVRALFLTVFNLPKEAYIATIGFIALISDAARVATYFSRGATMGNTLLYGLAGFIFLSFLGAKIAQGAVRKIPQKYFRYVIAGFLLVAGVRFLLAA